VGAVLWLATGERSRVKGDKEVSNRKLTAEMSPLSFTLRIADLRSLSYGRDLKRISCDG